MTRLLTFLSLVAAAVATSHETMGTEGAGASLPFSLPGSGGVDQISAIGGEGQHGGEIQLGGEGQIGGHQGQVGGHQGQVGGHQGQIGGEVQIGGGGQIGGHQGQVGGHQGQIGGDVQIGGGHQGGQITTPGNTIVGGGHGGVGGHSGSNAITVTIITTNNGGGAETHQWNEPPMQKGTVHQVTVGGDAGLVFTPETLNPEIGDMVHFTFNSQNHTVSQSTFSDPCSLMGGGVDSGFMPNPNNTVNPAPTMMFQVTTKDPIWMYCRQGPHCSRGMVFSLNPTAEQTHEEFKRLAMETGGEGGEGALPPPPPPAETVVGGEIPIGTGIPGIGDLPIGGEEPEIIEEPVGGEQPEVGGEQGQGGAVVPGSGNMGDGACSCSCLCGASEFPPGAGMGSVGGLGGSIPMPPARKRAVPFWY